MIAGWMTLLRDEKVIDRKYYHGKICRNKILDQWTKFCLKMDTEMIIQIEPNLEHQGLETFIKKEDLLGMPLRPKHYNVKEGPILPTGRKQQILRPPSNYSNNRRTEQYFEP